VFTFEDDQNYDILRAAPSTNYQVTNRVGQRPEEERLKILKASYPGSGNGIMSQQPDSLSQPWARAVMGVSSETTNQKSVNFEIAMGSLRITGVEIQDATDRSAIIRVQSDQPVVNYKAFMLSDPPRIVIDIEGALMTESMSRKATGKGPIKQIRSSQYRRKPKPVVRVVLDLDSTLPYQVAGLPDTFIILIGEAVETADKVEAPEIAMGPLRVTGVEIQEATANSAIIRIQADQAVVDYNSFMLSDPPRIVIDITGALLGEPILREKTGKGPIKQIRYSQFRRKPEPVVRVVIDLASSLAYQVAGLPDTFQLFIGEAVVRSI
jgi:hypothetical protein